MPRVRTIVFQIADGLRNGSIKTSDMNQLTQEHGLDHSELTAIGSLILRNHGYNKKDGRPKSSGPEPDPQKARQQSEALYHQGKFEAGIAINTPPKR